MVDRVPNQEGGRRGAPNDQAREHHAQALSLARQLKDRRGEAEALWRLGDIAADTAERAKAAELWRSALKIYEQLGVLIADTVRAAISQIEE